MKQDLPDWLSRDLEKVQVRVPRLPGRLIMLVIGVVLLLLILARSFIIVQAGERAVIFSKISGVLPYQLGEGMHPNVPLLWVPTKYDIKTLTYTMSGGGTEAHGEVHPTRQVSGDQVSDDSVVALTSDGLPITLDISVRFHIDPDNVWKLHREIGPEYVDKVVRPQARSRTRMAFAEFPVIDVYSGKRQAIVELIQTELRGKFRENFLILDEVLLRDIRFPEEFQKAIEEKQVAQQQAQQMVYELLRARSEQRQRIIEAEGEAGAIRKKAEALSQNPQLIQYEFVRKLPADTKIVITDSKTIISLGDVLK